MKKIKRAMRLLKNHIALWRNAVLVEYAQDGNVIHIQIRKCGLFKQYTGALFVHDIPIDLEKVIQSP